MSQQANAIMKPATTLKRRIIRKKRPKPQNKIEQEINDPDFEWNEEDDFVVEKIIADECWNGHQYYLIKWKGFDITMSTWERADKFTGMADLIEEYAKSKKGKKHTSFREETDIMMNPYRATEIHGHFLYGDEPSTIINTFVQFEKGKKTVFHEVVWKLRKTEEGDVQLENSILDSNLIY